MRNIGAVHDDRSQPEFISQLPLPKHFFHFSVDETFTVKEICLEFWCFQFFFYIWNAFIDHALKAWLTFWSLEKIFISNKNKRVSFVDKYDGFEHVNFVFIKVVE